jgi:addiction module HigA family antidote
VPNGMRPIHPGEVLREEFLIPLAMSAGALAKACGVPRTRIERLANEETGVTARYGSALVQSVRDLGRAVVEPSECL